MAGVRLAVVPALFGDVPGSSHALKRGWVPAAVTDWFHRCFVDGYDWVDPAEGGRHVPVRGRRSDDDQAHTSGGACIHRMSDLCEGCARSGGGVTRCREKPVRRAAHNAAGATPATAGHHTAGRAGTTKPPS